MIAKTPQWASRITGIPTERISWRKNRYEQAAYICCGWGPQRQANGELIARDAMLPIPTGKCRINGAIAVPANQPTPSPLSARRCWNPVKTAISSALYWTGCHRARPEMTASRRWRTRKEKPIKRSGAPAGTTRQHHHQPAPDINKTHEICR